ncbi:MAG: hypothetical protein CMF23_16120 [Ignavibacteriae bacterium]|nr:hypothetical protein [Ignavibacteriota bacterium]
MSKILVIEDDQATLIGLKQLLENESYEVITSSDGLDGLDKAMKLNPCAVLSDVNLPSMNGFDICRKLRESKFNQPIILLTSRADSFDKVIGLEIGADDYITKPFNSREVISRIRSQLRRYERNSEIYEQDKIGRARKRKLLAVMFTDMVNYSQKMNVNENLTLELLDIHNKIIKEKIKEYEGSIVEIIGDAFLAAFESTVYAVNCAIKIQKAFADYNSEQTADRKIEIRIGIHIGDLIEVEGKLKGDALNIAARIQQQSKPGRIYISEEVYNTIINKVKCEIDDKGNFQLKNITSPVKLYEINCQSQ